MFSVKVQVTEKAKETMARAGSSSEMRLDDAEYPIEALEFSVGNHRVEHITGVIHLYKKTAAKVHCKLSHPLTRVFENRMD